jgi:hypothetical protein
MINLDGYTYTNWEQLVIDKYGKDKLEEVINDGMFDFYIKIHNNIVKTESDESSPDDHEFFVRTALDYIFQNDEELQNKHDMNILKGE